jgi:hypothetical protein
MSVDDLQRTRFVHSPLMEAAESLWILSSGQVQSVHRGWYDDVVHRLSGVDRELLEAVVPGSVNQHLSVLRRAGLVTAWRSGRFVVYERTALGTSVVDSSRGR